MCSLIDAGIDKQDDGGGDDDGVMTKQENEAGLGWVRVMVRLMLIKGKDGRNKVSREFIIPILVLP